jgi:ankyrin repeat protein
MLGVDVNTTESAAGMTPLGIAAARGNLELAHLLLAADADIEPVNDAGLTALATGVANGHLELVQLLLDAGADAAIVDKRGNNLLHHAVDAGNADIVALLLEQDGIDINRARDQYGSTPLIMAARDNNVVMAQLLMDHGADLEVGDDWNDTPVNIAAYRGSLDVLKLLVARGAATNVVNTQGVEALEHSQNQNHAEVEAYLLSLQQAAYADMTQEEKDEALLTAVRSDDAAMVAEMLAAGADVNTSEQSLGLTPIAIATVRHNLEIATLLLDADADVTVIDKQKNNLLHHAATHNSTEIAALLLERDEIYLEHRRTQWGFTPLMVAAFEGNVVMIELLVAHGADMEAGDNWHDTPLNSAAWNGKLEAVQKLVELGANPDVDNVNGKNALDHAREQRHPEIEAFLLTVIDEE